MGLSKWKIAVGAAVLTGVFVVVARIERRQPKSTTAQVKGSCAERGLLRGGSQYIVHDDRVPLFLVDIDDDLVHPNGAERGNRGSNITVSPYRLDKT